MILEAAIDRAHRRDIAVGGCGFHRAVRLPRTVGKAILLVLALGEEAPVLRGGLWSSGRCLVRDFDLALSPCPLTIRCPICGAPKGKPCVVVVDGRPVRELPKDAGHHERRYLAMEETPHG